MTMVEMEDGSTMETNLPPEAVADLAKETAPAEPAESKEAPEPTEQPAEAKAEPEQAEAPKAEETQETEISRKAKPSPIANLLEKNHEMKTQLSDKDARIAELESKLANEAQKPASTESTDRVKQLAENYGLDETLLAEIVAAARENINPNLPKEVQDLLQERQAEKQQAEEQRIFNKRVDSLATTLKDDLLKNADVREKLQELAYSTELAPDGEPFYQKEVAELYFGFVKPEFEAGRVTAESSTSGEAIRESVMDFAEIASDPAKLEDFAQNATSEQFAKFQSWQREQSGSNEPLMKAVK